MSGEVVYFVQNRYNYGKKVMTVSIALILHILIEICNRKIRFDMSFFVLINSHKSELKIIFENPSEKISNGLSFGSDFIPWQKLRSRSWNDAQKVFSQKCVLSLGFVGPTLKISGKNRVLVILSRLVGLLGLAYSRR